MRLRMAHEHRAEDQIGNAMGGERFHSTQQHHWYLTCCPHTRGPLCVHGVVLIPLESHWSWSTCSGCMLSHADGPDHLGDMGLSHHPCNRLSPLCCPVGFPHLLENNHPWSSGIAGTSCAKVTPFSLY